MTFEHRSVLLYETVDSLQVKPDGMYERLQFVNLPFTAKGIRGGGNMLEQLVWSEFGDYIRDYLAGDAYGEI